MLVVQDLYMVILTPITEMQDLLGVVYENLTPQDIES